MKRIRSRTLLFILLPSLLLGVGCSVFVTVIHDDLVINIEDVQDPRMSVGDLVEINWSYANEGKLVQQKYVLVQHTILGALRSEFDLDTDDRDLNFIFQAPTTVFIMGYDSASAGMPVTQVAVDILFSTDYYLKANIEVVPPAQDLVAIAKARALPRLGYPVERLERTIEFTSFVAIRDTGINEVIDFFNGGGTGLDPQAPFRMISNSRNEDDGFDTIEGGGFPEVCHEGKVPDACHFHADVPDTFKLGEVDKANALVFGGALAYGGRRETVKLSNDEEIIIHRDPETTGEPIFIVLALHSGLNNVFAAPDGDLQIVDVYIGNVAQKLAVNAYAGTNQIDAALGSRNAEYSGLDTDNAVIVGEIKGAYIKDSFQLGNSEKFDVTLNFTGVTWRVPLRSDDDLLGIPTARHACELSGTCQAQ